MINIKEIQQRLSDLGYNPGTGDCIRGAKTDAAIVRFKKAHGLRARPYLGPLTYKKLMGKAMPASVKDFPWMIEARSKMGVKEIPGPRHNNWIAKGWKRLGASWFSTDETPWCGFYVAHCLDAAGLPIVGGGLFARAKAWLKWGKASVDCYGAIVVFGRKGGGHVGFLVGQSTKHYYVLGGNQRNAVNIMPLAKSRALGFRWPSGEVNPNKKLPRMSGGIVSRNEA